jgi:transposase
MGYTKYMASLQSVRVKGRTYWRIVESRRVNGKPRPVPVLYLGKADDLLARLRSPDPLRIRSLSHGAVATLWALAGELAIQATIDRHLASAGRRTPKDLVLPDTAPLRPAKSNGLSVGQSLSLVAVGRACHPTSKRAFAQWARGTTLAALAGIDVEQLTSQHFWDQMDQVPVEILPRLERDIVSAALSRLQIPVDTLLFDATNFFTFMASTNARIPIAARGKQKQKRSDLRPIGVAVLCSRTASIPLWHCTYGGNLADAKSFAAALPLIQQRLAELGRSLDSLTIVYDKGNVSQANQALVDAAGLHYVSALTVASQPKLVESANSRLDTLDLDGEPVPAYRTRHPIWGKQRTVVVLVSQRLLAGQARGILQHVASAQKWLIQLADILARGLQRRDRARIQRDIETRLRGRQFLSRVLRVELSGDDPNLRLTHSFDQAAFDALCQSTLGRIVLVTDREEWKTEEIIAAYRSQAHIERLFRSMKNPSHIALRPQHHWTEHKVHVHVFTCVIAYLLEQLLLLRAQRAGIILSSAEDLLTRLTQVRQATVVRLSQSSAPTVSTQIEEMDEALTALWRALTEPS